jgi:transcriptional regulator with XRE-family HTH domain
MQEMEQQTWRQLLGDIIADVQERKRLAAHLGVNPISLTRWAQNETNPRPQHLHRLTQVVASQYRVRLSQLIEQDFPDLADVGEAIESDDSTGKIPSDFYESVLTAYMHTRKEQRFFTVSNRVLTQALSLLDPRHRGMSLSIARCMTPLPGQKVRSLREVTGLGTPPWPSILTQEALFLGIESLAGYAVTTGRSYTIENRADGSGFLPIRWEEWEVSTAVSPIWFENRIAGCLIASSVQPGYFLPSRQSLVERCAQLLTLAFQPEDFYEQHDIVLFFMPSRDVQREKAVDFRQRLSQVMLEASREGQPMNIEQAERRVWQQLEEELLNFLIPGIE